MSAIGVYDPAGRIGRTIRSGSSETVICFDELMCDARAQLNATGIDDGAAPLLAKDLLLDDREAVVIDLAPGDSQALSVCTGAVRRLLDGRLTYLEIVSAGAGDAELLLSFGAADERAALVVCQNRGRLHLSESFALPALLHRLAIVRRRVAEADTDR